MEDSMEIPLKSRNKTTYDSTIALLGIYPKETETEKDTCKGVRQGCILSPCLFNLYSEYIMRDSGLEEAQLESGLPGEISITSDMQMTPPLWQKPKKN